MTKILAVSVVAIALGACASQRQNEGFAGQGKKHFHEVVGQGKVTHQHKGNSTPSHTHKYEQIIKEIEAKQ